MKYFGTDGIRGIWQKDIDKKLILAVGKSIREFFGSGKYIIGRDSRASGTQIIKTLLCGIGNDDTTVIDIGIVPTPVISYYTKANSAKCGIVVSASHNPAEFNGIKLFDEYGQKLCENAEKKFDSLIKKHIKTTDCYHSPNIQSIDITEEYIKHICSFISNLKGLKVCLDCAYGAMGNIAMRAFSNLGASIMAFNCDYISAKINHQCGSQYPHFLLSKLKQYDCKLGFAFDGDGDRLVVIFDNQILDGDSVLYNISKSIKLNKNTIVATVLSNGSLQTQLNKDNIKLIKTAVGDKNIARCMMQNNYSLGGEQSGHYIIKPYSTTGDGLLAALIFAQSIYQDNKLVNPIKLDLMPQKTISLNAPKSIMNDFGLLQIKSKYEMLLENKCRMIVRYSGTEPKIRIMIECNDQNLIEQAIQEFEIYIYNYNQFLNFL
ncbi:MAG: hypothetical protein LBU60_05910 [Clostridiales bacterium]|jgi:phosphoglucosamine mutase|nr:hypothetical protein [Clostridiales bacterium]